jgi:hypothetical protein
MEADNKWRAKVQDATIIAGVCMSWRVMSQTNCALMMAQMCARKAQRWCMLLMAGGDDGLDLAEVFLGFT